MQKKVNEDVRSSDFSNLWATQTIRKIEHAYIYIVKFSFIVPHIHKSFIKVNTQKKVLT